MGRNNFEEETRRRYMEADYESDKSYLISEYELYIDDDYDEPVEDRHKFIKWLLEAMRGGGPC